uniref:(California timema) hypothetical protein n=1 Tax=Timema californicum TaxID=61474 RepID=A0A7R9JFF9_TIMCA|nr:unnamed protein product [Timema californicum]
MGLAEEELLREAKRGAARASVSGPLGWVKCPLRPTNKRFLRNTILHTINNNSRRSSKTRKNQDSRNKSVLSSNSKTSVDSTKYQPNKRVEGHEKTNKNKVDKSIPPSSDYKIIGGREPWTGPFRPVGLIKFGSVPTQKVGGGDRPTTSASKFLVETFGLKPFSLPRRLAYVIELWIVLSFQVVLLSSLGQLLLRPRRLPFVTSNCSAVLYYLRKQGR